MDLRLKIEQHPGDQVLPKSETDIIHTLGAAAGRSLLLPPETSRITPVSPPLIPQSEYRGQIAQEDKLSRQGYFSPRASFCPALLYDLEQLPFPGDSCGVQLQTLPMLSTTDTSRGLKACKVGAGASSPSL